MQTKDQSFLGTEPVGKLLVRLAVPTVIAQLVNMLYNIVDRIYIGHIAEIGSLALTGVGVCMPIIMIVTAFAALVASGSAPRASIALGRGDHDTAEKLLGGSFSLQIAISLLLTAVLATAVFASAATIKDVPAKNWAYPYVSKMVDMEIMQTHDGGYFYPDLPTSRGEFVLYLWRAMDAPAIGVDAGFTDVSWDDPWSGAVNWAVGVGITNGVSPTRFDPYGDLTREQAFTFLYRAMDYLGVAPTYGEDHEFYTQISEFHDYLQVSSWSADAIQLLLDIGIVQGTDNGYLMPKRDVNNAATATILYRAMDYMDLLY